MFFVAIWSTHYQESKGQTERTILTALARRFPTGGGKGPTAVRFVGCSARWLVQVLTRLLVSQVATKNTKRHEKGHSFFVSFCVLCGHPNRVSIGQNGRSEGGGVLAIVSVSQSLQDF